MVGQSGGDDAPDLDCSQAIHQCAGTDAELERGSSAEIEGRGFGNILVQRLQHRQEAAKQKAIGDRATRSAVGRLDCVDRRMDDLPPQRRRSPWRRIEGPRGSRLRMAWRLMRGLIRFMTANGPAAAPSTFARHSVDLAGAAEAQIQRAGGLVGVGTKEAIDGKAVRSRGSAAAACRLRRRSPERPRPWRPRSRHPGSPRRSGSRLPG